MVDYDPKSDLYTLLAVSETATLGEIRRAHRARIRIEHPDKRSGDNGRAANINHARDILEDPKARAEYDEKRRAYLAKTSAPCSPAQPRARSTKKPARAPVTRTKAASQPPRARAKRRQAPESPSPVRPQSTTTPPDKLDAKTAAAEVAKHVERGEWGHVAVWFVALGLLGAANRARRPPR